MKALQRMTQLDADSRFAAEMLTLIPDGPLARRTSMKKKRILITASIIIIVSNLPVISTILMGEIDSGHFRYSNADASFTDIEHFDWMRPWMNEWVVFGFIEDQRPVLRNMGVFRLYKINPLCFWRWRYYLLVSRKFRYKSWKEIEPDRMPFVPDNKWQDF